MKDGADLVKTHLLTVAEITAIVGTQIYTEEADSSVRGANIVVYRIGGDDISDSLVMARPLVQVSCYSTDKDQAKALARLVIEKLGDRQGTIDGTWVISRYQTDRIFRTSGWWHAPVDISLRYRA